MPLGASDIVAYAYLRDVQTAERDDRTLSPDTVGPVTRVRSQAEKRIVVLAAWNTCHRPGITIWCP